jgi:23S rRNA pseudouridine2605 synthase
MRTNNNKGRRPAGGTGKGKSGFSGGRDKKEFKSDHREERGDNDKRSEKGSFDRERKSGSGDRKSSNRTSFNNRDEKPKRFDREGKSFSKDRDSYKGGDDKPRSFKKEGSSFSKDREGFKSNDSKSKSFKRDNKSFSKDREGFKSSDSKSKSFKRDDKSFSKDNGDFRDRGDKRKFSRDGNSFSKDKRGFDDQNDKPKRYKKEGQTVDNPNYFKNKERSSSEEWNDNDFERSKKSKSERDSKPARVTKEVEKNSSEEGENSNFSENRNNKRKEFIERSEKRREERSDNREKRKRSDKPTKQKNDDGETLIRLNKFIANSGVCSRREADKLIESGAVTVNGKIVSELGYKVNPTDVVNYGGANIKREKNVYVLLNKPKDYITTLDDPEGRKTVMELVKSAGKERIYPVGRLDRNTTGLLLFTNDGDMTMKLTHPKNNIQKLYGVEIDKSIRPEDFKAILDGFELEDGFIKADKLEFVGGSTNRKELGIEIHSGKNRIVRRMFEHLGYKVVKLDRVMFAGLTKKDLPRGKWRFLSEKEIGYLRMKK